MLIIPRPQRRTPSESMLAVVVASAAVASAVVFAWLRVNRARDPMPAAAEARDEGAGGEDAQKQKRFQMPTYAYILENQVTHARLLPQPSAHAFSYPTLALLVSLDALEAGALDLGRGWLFGYGGTGMAWRVTGLRSKAYLAPCVGASGTREGKDAGTGIKVKMREALGQFGHDGGRLGEVWMLSMPSYLGYEGINPLTVYYCYEGGGERLVWVVLEIHNTFGEKHVHVLETGVGEDEEEKRPHGFDHQWTFARDFHVSPFNDRLGHYIVSVTAPLAPSSRALAASPPRPKVRIHLHAAPSPSSSPSLPSVHTASDIAVGPLKLTATLFARHAVPLTSANLMRALAQYPLALFLSFARILYHARILHYVKRLDVFPRPDPKPAMRAWGLSGVASLKPDSVLAREGGAAGEEKPRPGRVYGGIGWQDEGPLEAYARRAVEGFLARRATELGVRVVLESGDPSVPRRVFAPSAADCAGVTDELVMRYAAPRVFPTLLLAPCASHMLLVGKAEDLFRVSSEELFGRVFAAPLGATMSWVQSVRLWLLPGPFARCPGRHPLDEGRGVANALVVCLVHAGDLVEGTVFTAVKARFVPGSEPWRRWERAAMLLQDLDDQ